MAKSNRHRGAFIFGSILGGAVGAVAALWNTPQSGYELRQKLGLESEPASTTVATGEPSSLGTNGSSRARRPGSSLQDKAIGLLEQAAAPLVGVKLGQTANNSQPGATLATSHARETEPVVQGVQPPGSTLATEPVMPEGV